jgi:spermidine synthase
MTALLLMIPVYSFTLFISALLLFWLEPMFGKMILPLLGGSPAVWITAMLFYQLALLIGYSYAHATSRWLSPTKQALIHLGLLLFALSLLPIAVPSGWAPPTEVNPAPWLLCLLTVALGAPFVLLSATTPMVQRWFATTSHPQAANPYFLYSVSNAGSLAGLYVYPLLLEPTLRLAEQSHAWSIGFVALTILVAVSASLAWRYQAAAAAIPKDGAAVSEPAASSETIGWRRLLHWIVLAFAPSSLMLSVTSFITTDIAAIPLMWVVPLSLYLLTFIIAFARKPVISSRFAGWLQPFLVIPLCIALVSVLGKTGVSPLYFLPLHLAVFFISALVCHFELARLRPSASNLTKFFLALSFGGALGGVLNVLVAPFLFNDVYEYPLGLALACLLCPWPEESIWRRKPAIVAAVVACLCVVAAELMGRPDEGASDFSPLTFKLLLALGAISLFVTRRQPVWFAAGVGMYLLSSIVVPSSRELLFADRDFFGVIRVRVSPDHTYRMFEHGTTVHGMQALDADHHLEPLSYYSKYGGLGQALTALSRTKADAKIGIIGLGAGSLVSYGQPDWRYTLFEIDPGVAKAATNPQLFTFLSDGVHHSEIILGDGRLSMQKMPASYFDAIILDAFSSDVIPLHLLTEEAIRLYLDKLAPGGMIVFHLSNRYFNLAPIVASTARDLGLVSLMRVSPAGTIEGTTLPYYASIVAVLARKPEDFGALADMQGWKPITLKPGAKSWTDDHSNLLQALW